MKKIEEIRELANFKVEQVSHDGGYGVIYKDRKPYGSVIWSFGEGWEHVSIAPFNRRRKPDWDDMCRLKDMFFYDDEVVVQYHPAKKDYVNILDNCLHLWRPTEGTFPTPPTILV